MAQSLPPTKQNNPNEPLTAVEIIAHNIKNAKYDGINAVLNTVTILIIFVMILWELPNATNREFQRRAIIIGITLILEYLLVVSIQISIILYGKRRGYSGIWSSMLGVVFAHIIYKTYRIIKRKENVRKHLIFYLILIVYVIMFVLINIYYWQNQKNILYGHSMAAFVAMIAHGIVITVMQTIFKL